MQYIKLGQYTLPETCENWIGSVKNGIIMLETLWKFGSADYLQGKLIWAGV